MVEQKLKYDYDFEVRVLYLLLNDLPFFTSISSILKSEYFNNDVIGWSVDTLIKYHKEYKVIATESSLRAEFNDSNNGLQEAQFNKVLEDVNSIATQRDLPITAEKILAFCKRQNMVNTIFKTADLLSDDDSEESYDRIYSMVKDAVSAGQAIDEGYNYTAEIDRRYTEDKRDPIPTGFKLIDEGYLKGGLSHAELGVFVCPPKGGKSWLMVSSAVNAVRTGKKVLYITMELSSAYVGRRFDANLLEMPIDNLDSNIDKIKEVFDAYNIYDNIKIKKFSRPTIYTIENFIDSLIHTGFTPDIIFIDYADLIRGSKSDLRMSLREVYEDLRALADTYQVPIWTASQSNRASVKAQVITGDLIAEDFSKIATSDVVISFSNHDIFYIMANRFGEDGVAIGTSLVDKSMGKFEVSEVVDIEDLASASSGSSGGYGSGPKSKMDPLPAQTLKDFFTE